MAVNVLISCIQNSHTCLRQFTHVLDEHDHRNQQTPPSSTLHIELLEQFEGSKTSKTFIYPCSQKIELSNPGEYTSDVRKHIIKMCQFAPDLYEYKGCLSLCTFLFFIHQFPLFLLFSQVLFQAFSKLPLRCPLRHI